MWQVFFFLSFFFFFIFIFKINAFTHKATAVQLNGLGTQSHSSNVAFNSSISFQDKNQHKVVLSTAFMGNSFLTPEVIYFGIS
jgi:hypothetical protein